MKGRGKAFWVGEQHSKRIVRKGTWLLEESEKAGNGGKEAVMGGRTRLGRTLWAKEKNLNFIGKDPLYILRDSCWILCGD